MADTDDAQGAATDTQTDDPLKAALDSLRRARAGQGSADPLQSRLDQLRKSLAGPGGGAPTGPSRAQREIDVADINAGRGAPSSVGPVTPQSWDPSMLSNRPDPRSLLNRPFAPYQPPQSPRATVAATVPDELTPAPPQPMGYDDYMKLGDLAVGALGFTPSHRGVTSDERLQNIAAAIGLGAGPAIGDMLGAGRAAATAAEAADALADKAFADLGLDRATATPQDVNDAFREAAKRTHPDVPPDVRASRGGPTDPLEAKLGFLRAQQAKETALQALGQEPVAQTPQPAPGEAPATPAQPQAQGAPSPPPDAAPATPKGASGVVTPPLATPADLEAFQQDMSTDTYSPRDLKTIRARLMAAALAQPDAPRDATNRVVDAIDKHLAKSGVAGAGPIEATPAPAAAATPGAALHDAQGQPIPGTEVSPDLEQAAEARRSETNRRMVQGTPPLGMDERRAAAAQASRDTPLPPIPTAEQGVPAPADITKMPTNQIVSDPSRFQFKNLGDEGVSTELRGVTKWNPNLAGVVSVWKDPANGKTYVVNGHHRLDLAKRLGVPSVNVQHIDAPSAEAARAEGAYMNIAEGRGTATDVGKFMRDMKQSPEEMQRLRGVSLRGDLAKSGAALSKLAPDVFDRVAAAKVPEKWGVAIGSELAGEPEMQRTAISLAEKSGARLTDPEVRELAKQVKAAGTEGVSQDTLFGKEQGREALFVPRAQLSAALQKNLAADKRLFSYVSKGARPEELGRAGATTIDVGAAREMAEGSAKLEEVFNRLSTRTGPLANVLTAGARRIAHGEKSGAVARDLYPAVRSAVEEELGAVPGQQGAGGQGGGAHGLERGAVTSEGSVAAQTAAEAESPPPVETSKDENQNALFERGPVRYAEIPPATPERATKDAVTVFGSVTEAKRAAIGAVRSAGAAAQTDLFRPALLDPAAREAAVARAALPHAWVPIKGQTPKDPAELHGLLWPFRSPAMERLHFLLHDADGNVVEHQMHTSGALNFVAMGPSFIEDLIADMKRAGAIEATLAHNHPSGVPKPSSDDLAFTGYVGGELEKAGLKLRGQYVIDDTTGTWIEHHGDYATLHPVKLPGAKDAVDWTTTHGQKVGASGQIVSGQPSMTPHDVAQVAIATSGALPDHRLDVLYLNTQSIAVALEPHSVDAAETAGVWLPDRLKALAADQALIVVGGEAQFYRAADKFGDSKGVLDVFRVWRPKGDAQPRWISARSLGILRSAPPAGPLSDLHAHRVFDRPAGSRAGVSAASAEGTGNPKALRHRTPHYVSEASAFHGSPHRFDEFSQDKIGTGQGAHTYGYGHYFAEVKGVARTYREQLSPEPEISNWRVGDLPPLVRTAEIGGVPETQYIDYSPTGRFMRPGETRDSANARASIIEHLLADEHGFRGVASEPDALRRLAIKSVEADRDEYRENWPAAVPEAERILAGIKENGVAMDFHGRSGAVYNVKLNVDPSRDMLDWDKKVNEQSPAVRTALNRLLDQHYDAMESLRPGQNVPEANDANFTGGEAYQGLARAFGSQQEASEALRMAGVKGVQYLDQLSRQPGMAAATHNYVVFDAKDIGKPTAVEEKGPEYQGEHAPADRESGAPLHDLTGNGTIYPDDVYGPHAVQYYGTGEPAMDHRSFAIANSVKGHPGRRVTAYRAIPDDLTVAARIAKLEGQKAHILRRGKLPPRVETRLGRSAYYAQISDELDRLRALPPESKASNINAGDWVTINRDYARMHGQSALRGNYKIAQKTVRADELYTSGDSIHEWGYWPKGTSAATSVGERAVGYDALHQPEEEPQESMFSPKAGTAASRPLSAVERDAKSQLPSLQERLRLTKDPKARAELTVRIATIEKLLNRDKSLTPEELASQAAAAGTPPEPVDPKQMALFEQGKPYVPGGLPVKQKGVVDDFNKLMDPASRGPDAKAAARSLRAAIGDYRRTLAVARARLQAAAKIVPSLETPEGVDFYDRAEGGEVQADPKLDDVVKLIRDLYKPLVRGIQDLGTGKLVDPIENYMSHLWADPEEAEKVMGQLASKRPLRGRASFLKERVLPRLSDGIRAGLKPVTDNPVELNLLKMREMAKYLLGQHFLADGKAAGWAQYVPVGQQGPKGWMRIDDPTFAVWGRGEGGELALRGNYWMPEGAGQVVKNYLSPGLRGNAIYDAYMRLGNTLNQFQLGASGFHAGFSTMTAVVSRAAQGIGAMRRATLPLTRPTKAGAIGATAGAVAGSIMGPAGSMLGALAGSTAARFLADGLGLRKAYLHPGTGSLVEQRLADLLAKSGGQVTMDPTYKYDALKALRQAVKDKNVPAGLAHTIGVAMQAVAWPTMEFYVPLIKLGAFSQMMRSELAGMKPESGELFPTDQQVTDAAQGVWHSVDNRFGQVSYDTRFWNNSIKQALQGTVRAVGWDAGSVDELVGGLKDGLKGKGSRRFDFLIALVLTTALINVLTQLGLTGEGPRDIHDLFEPRDGTLDAEGNPNRLSPATYMKDVLAFARHPIDTIGHKLHPVLSFLEGLIGNKDFYGDQIRNPGDPVGSQLQQVGKYFANEFTPISVRNMSEAARRGTTGARGALPMVGWSPAPREAERTKAQNLMTQYLSAGGGESRTPEQVAQGTLRADVEERFRRHEVGYADARRELLGGGLNPVQTREALSHMMTSPLVNQFQQLTLAQAKDVFAEGTPREQALWRPTLFRKIAAAHPRNPPQQRAPSRR